MLKFNKYRNFIIFNTFTFHKNKHKNIENIVFNFKKNNKLVRKLFLIFFFNFFFNFNFFFKKKINEFLVFNKIFLNLISLKSYKFFII